MNRKAAKNVGRKTEEFTANTNKSNELLEEIDKLYEGGDYEEALTKCNDAEAKYPSNKLYFWHTKALCLDCLKRPDEAKLLIESILSIEPSHKGARAWLAGNEFEQIFPPDINKLTPTLVTKIESYAEKLGANKSLVTSINQMCESLGGYMNVAMDAISYQKRLKEENEKKDKDKNYQIDYKSLKGSLNVLIDNQESLKGLSELEEKAKELRIADPEDYVRFARLFSFMSRLEQVESKYEPELQKICSLIGVHYEYIKIYFKMYNQLKEDDDENQDNDGLTPPSPPSEFPTFKKSSFDRNSKPLGQILYELAIINDSDASFDTPEQLSKEKIDEYLILEEKDIFSALSIYKKTFDTSLAFLVDGYDQFKRHSASWQDRSSAEVRAWADRTRQESSVDVHEALGVMDRANSLITGGHYLRHPQALAILMFLDSSGGGDHVGRMIQISTGEGKTLIVSLFAAIQVLRGHTVDVITSNTVLAEEGAKERRKFYNLLGISVAHNNPDKIDKSFKGSPYKADVMYGSISSFQFDYLRDSFECMGTRVKRKFDTVMIDEVDSMLIDNGGHIAKLSGPLPGMDSLRYIYIKIWMEVCNEWEKLKPGYLAQLNARQDNVGDYIDLEANLMRKCTDAIKMIVKTKVDISEYGLVPSHLKEYAANSMNKWIDNAVFAGFYCQVDKQYLIKRVNDEDVVVPVDYENTGVTLKNTIWSNGLHQFVQLKHNLRLTSESLTSSFISNIGYIRKYKSICGLTGTLGSRAERQLLSTAYEVSFASLPTFRTKRFRELPLCAINEVDLRGRVAVEAVGKCEDGRAVLVICETIDDLNQIEKKLQHLQKFDETKYRIKTFRDEDNSSVTSERLESGDIVISTNIAGRGTDFKTSKDVEANGGLHVIVTFLPCNKRVEDQAFGRTARQGNSGTAQIITTANEEALSRIADAGLVLKRVRDMIEVARINDIIKVKLNEIDYNDRIFGFFSEVYAELYKKHKDDHEYPYFLNDLKEFWAFWLEKNNAADSSQKSANQAEAAFERFKSEAGKILSQKKINFNPFYLVRQADDFIDNQKLDEAVKALKNAISLGNSADVVYPAHVKLFEIAIEQGEQLKERFKEAVASIIFITYKKKQGYLNSALEHIDKAIGIIDKECNFVSDLIKNEEFAKILHKPIEENFLIKHLNSRISCLEVYMNNLKSIREQIVETGEDGLAIQRKVPRYLKDHKPAGELNILDSEVCEIADLSYDEIYSMKKIYSVPESVIKNALGQIYGGLATLAIGIAFPPALVVCGPVAGALISEGVTDIVIELVSQGESEFSEIEYAKSKVISYGISLATMGISAISTSLKLLQRAARACRSIANWLKRSPFMTTIFDKVASKMLKMANYLKNLHLDRVGEASKLANLSRKELVMHHVRDVVKSTFTSITAGVVEEKLTRPALEAVLIALKPKIKEKIKTNIQSTTLLVKKLVGCKEEKIKKEIGDIVENPEFCEHAIDVASGIMSGVLDSASDMPYLRVAGFVMDTSFLVEKILNYANRALDKLNTRLQTQTGLSHSEEKLSIIIEHLADVLTEKVFSFVVEIGSKIVSKTLTDPLIENLAGKIVDGKMKTDVNKINDDLKPVKSKNEGHEGQDVGQEIKERQILLGLRPNATEKDIRQSFRESVLRESSFENSDERVERLRAARDYLLANYNRLPSFIFTGSDVNDCAQNVLSRLFKVEKYDLFRLTGVAYTPSGAHVSDCETQLQKLGLKPKVFESSVQDSAYRYSDLSRFLQENNTSKAMMFLHEANDGMGHVVLLKKDISGQLIIHDEDKNYQIEAFDGRKVTLLSAENLDSYVDIIRQAINDNTIPYPSPTRVVKTGQNFDDGEVFGANKEFFEQLKADDLNTNEPLVQSNVAHSNDNNLYEYLIKDPAKSKRVLYNLEKSSTGVKNLKIHNEGSHVAYYSPFLKNTHNWSELKKTEVKLPKSIGRWMPWTPRVMLTDATVDSHFTSSSYILAIGDNDIRFYTDSNPTANVDQKIIQMQAETNERRQIYRIDHIQNRHIQFPADMRTFYPNELAQNTNQLSFTNSTVLMYYDEICWNIIVQNKQIDLVTLTEKHQNLQWHHFPRDTNTNGYQFGTVKNRLGDFRDNPTRFLNENFIIQVYPKTKTMEANYILWANKQKRIKFDLRPGTVLKNKPVSYIDAISDSNGPFQRGFYAHYSPYLGSTENWSSLNETGVQVKLKNPEHNFVLTGTFSGCSMIIAVDRTSDMKIYHDGASDKAVSEKLDGLLPTNENRTLIRIDDVSKMQIAEMNERIDNPKRRLFYGIGIPNELAGKDRTGLGHIMLYHTNGEWYVMITSYVGINFSNFNSYPINVQQFRLNDLLN